MAASLNRWLAALALLGSLGPAAAIEFLPDPTRPAAELAAADGAGSTQAQPAAKAGLQSVIIAPGYRAAVIDGIMVRQGGKVGDAILVEVRENSVVLRNAQGRQVMELFPGVRLNKAAAGMDKRVGK